MLSVALVHSGGPYPTRVREYLESQPEARVTAYELPTNLPLVLDEDDAADLIPAGVREAEVVIAVHLHPGLLAELPYAMSKGVGQALLVPREAPDWVRPGLVNQVTRACARFDIESAFPKPFCEFEPLTPVLRQFGEEYRVGRHRFSVECEGGVITAAHCLSSSGCGLTAWVVEQLVGRPGNETLPRVVAELLHLRPCLASMALDDETGDTVMHHSIAIMEKAGREALEKLEAERK